MVDPTRVELALRILGGRRATVNTTGPLFQLSFRVFFLSKKAFGTTYEVIVDYSKGS